MIRSILHALRVGASVPNPTPLKWAGVAVAVAIIALEIAKSYGVLADVSESALIELVMAALVLYSQIASTEKIGVLPKAQPRVIDRLSDVEIADLLRPDDDMDVRLRKLRRQSVSTRPDVPESRDSAGFPSGPFFGGS